MSKCLRCGAGTEWLSGGVPGISDAKLERLMHLEELALIWSAYQDDDSKKDQATDSGLRRQADEAEENLLSALL